MKFLFDLGGVFFDWDPNYFYANVFETEDEKNFFLSEVCNDVWNIKQDAGRTIIDAEAELIPKYPKYEKEIKLYYKNHRKMIRGTFEESIKVLNFLNKNNYKCYVLSNWSSETFYGPHQSMLDDYPFLNKFDGLLISGEDKLIKPDPAIYELAIKRFNLIPKETVFIDDKLENINAAKDLDLNTIHLVNPNNIETEINNFLI
jgi:2-haloacid dehalogenase|tara:strand:- start:489 stop:1094 length:606 start_codon:yes stop_codon:yes gene_type:complete